MLFVRYDELTWLAFRARMHRMMPSFKEDAALLLADQFTDNGTLPFSGHYAYDPLISNARRCLLIVEPNELLLTRSHGLHPIACITEGKDGSLRFKVNYLDGKHDNVSVELRPDGTVPRAIELSQPCEMWLQLEPNWFLIYWVFDGD